MIDKINPLSKSFNFDLPNVESLEKKEQEYEEEEYKEHRDELKLTFTVLENYIFTVRDDLDEIQFTSEEEKTFYSAFYNILKEVLKLHQIGEEFKRSCIEDHGNPVFLQECSNATSDCSFDIVFIRVSVLYDFCSNVNEEFIDTIEKLIPSSKYLEYYDNIYISIFRKPIEDTSEAKDQLTKSKIYTILPVFCMRMYVKEIDELFVVSHFRLMLEDFVTILKTFQKRKYECNISESSFNYEELLRFITLKCIKKREIIPNQTTKE